MPRRPAYFAAFIDLLGKKVVVVGGGKVATAKVRALLPCQPEPLIVVAPEVGPFIACAAQAGRLVWLQHQYRAADGVLEGAALAFAATDDRALNARVAADAHAAAVPVLAVDDAANCDFIAPALVQRGDLSVAISTGGRSPAMARRTRERLDQALPSHWGDLLAVAADARERLGPTRGLVEPESWQLALRGEVEDLVAAGALAEAADLLVCKLERSLFEPCGQGGMVSLVGAGPGDPELLTLKAVRRLADADVVVYDRLVGERVLDYAAPGAERIDVGKTPGGRGPGQAQINALLIELAQKGRRVVRLKGGDPFVFGRGGEEVLALARAGVPFEVVPGVTSALAAPAAAGIPVTHRGMSSSVTVLNGHDPDQHDWPALAASGATLVFLMAVEQIEVIAARLLAAGRSADEPAAIVERATTARQRVISATLADIATVSRAENVEAPAVVVVGPTAALASALGTRAVRHTSAAPATRVAMEVA